jgi:hypothetical protein
MGLLLEGLQIRSKFEWSREGVLWQGCHVTVLHLPLLTTLDVSLSPVTLRGLS